MNIGIYAIAYFICGAVAGASFATSHWSIEADKSEQARKQAVSSAFEMMNRVDVLSREYNMLKAHCGKGSVVFDKEMEGKP